MAAAVPVVQATIDCTRLPNWRRAAGITQREAARRIGVSPQELARVESALRPGGMVTKLIDLLTGAEPEATAPKA